MKPEKCRPLICFVIASNEKHFMAISFLNRLNHTCIKMFLKPFMVKNGRAWNLMTRRSVLLRPHYSYLHSIQNL